MSGLSTVGELDLGGLGLHPEVRCPLCFCDFVLTWMFGRVIYSAVSSKYSHLVTAAQMRFISPAAISLLRLPLYRGFFGAVYPKQGHCPTETPRNP